MNMEMLAVAGLVGYLTGDLVAPIRRTVTASLTQMREAVREDVQDREGGRPPRGGN